jgi:hypothetical protein
MVKQLGSFLLLLSPSLLFAQKKEEIAAINSLCGCFEIEFMYSETFAADSAYKLSAPYHERALEWVTAEEASGGKFVFQHLLAINDKMVIKHWREDWEYQKDNRLSFTNAGEWKKVKATPEQVKGQWTQSVWEVDDAPRYFGSSAWIQNDGKYYWENTADAPLPRREYTKRSDYNILRRGNRIVISDTGWTHEQDNLKVLREAGKKDQVLAQEKGFNIYKKVADSRCAVAKAWWNDHKAFWNSVRKSWDVALANVNEVHLKKVIDKKSLGKYLSDMEEKNDKDALAKLPELLKRFISDTETAAN